MLEALIEFGASFGPMLVAAAGALVFLWTRLKTFLHIAQQEEYHPRRTLAWWLSHGAFDRRGTVVALGAWGWALLYPPYAAWIAMGAGLAFIGLALWETDPTRRAKKRLVMTLRATRIHRTAWGLAVVACALAAASGQLAAFAVVFQAVPLLIVAAILLLSPVEKNVAAGFQREAMDKVRALNPLVIAITGSFGKTSVKHILGHLLAAKAPTLITPGSVNSPLGVTRVVREQLSARHKFFVVEMGAYGVGSIRRVCHITPPDLSMLITIGPAHYERFKTLEQVARAKIEIGEEAIAKGGRFITADELLKHQPIAEFAQQHAGSTTLTGAGRRFELMSARAVPAGTEIHMRAGEEEAILTAPIYGPHQAQNVFMAVVAALSAGLSLDDVSVALPSTPQIKHRCEVKRAPGGATLIDDSYNSNPAGFRSALEVLDALGKAQGGRRIVVTPGMVELGALHDEAHFELGEVIAEKADLVVLVRPERIASLEEGLAGKAPEGLVVKRFESFNTARAWLDEEAREPDVVLIENDLPDIYEMTVSL